MIKVILISAVDEKKLKDVKFPNIKNVEYYDTIQSYENMVEVVNVLNYIKDKMNDNIILIIKEKIDLNPSSTRDYYKNLHSLQFAANLSYLYDNETDRWINTKYDRSIDNNIHNNIITYLNGLG